MGKRGPAPKPTKLKLLAGNPGQRKLNDHEPQYNEVIPDPPEILTGEALKEWERVTKMLSSSGVMTEVDGVALAAYCQHYANWVLAIDTLQGSELIQPHKGNAVPMVIGCMKVINESSDRMLKYLKEFGMTPSSRSGIKVEPKKKADPIKDIFG